MRLINLIGLSALCLLFVLTASQAQERVRRPREAVKNVVRKDDVAPAVPKSRVEQDKLIAAQFAPVVYQGLGENPRADLITNFDFDGDWRGDNNWNNLANKKFALKAYVYYSVSETATHYFVHYAFFHPRDYKGEVYSSTLLDSVLRQTLPQLGKPPAGAERVNDIALSHENDLEGCLIVAAKNGNGLADAQVQYVETMAHNVYVKYYAPGINATVGEAIELEGTHARLFIEPKGHGVERYQSDKAQANPKQKGLLTYTYTGIAEEPAVTAVSAGYDLVSIYDTFWQRARQGNNETFGETLDYQTRKVLRLVSADKSDAVEQAFSQLGSAFLGKMGFQNKARPPWAWFDESERDRPRGEWFFDPAAVVARHFSLNEKFSLTYVRNPYFSIGE